MLFAAVIIFIVFIMAAALVMLMMLNRNPSIPGQKKETKQMIREKPVKPTYRHISDLIKIEEADTGIIYAGGKYLGLARIEGTNFSVLSDGEQDVREEVLIGIQNQINYPVQYITSTVITDTESIAREVRANAANMEKPQLVSYNNLYAAELEEMKKRRQAMAQVSWLVISDDGEGGDPVSQIREKMVLLQEAFRVRAGIILTPLVTTEEILDALQQIMLPEKLSRPSEITLLGGLSPIKLNIREIENIA